MQAVSKNLKTLNSQNYVGILKKWKTNEKVFGHCGDLDLAK